MRCRATIFKSRLFLLRRIYIGLIIVLMLGFTFAAGCSTGPSGSSIEVGKSAPDFTLVDLNDSQVSLSDFRGKNVVIAFFPLAWTPI